MLLIRGILILLFFLSKALTIYSTHCASLTNQNEIASGASIPEKSTQPGTLAILPLPRNNIIADEKLHRLIRRSPASPSKTRNANPVESNFRFVNSVHGRWRYNNNKGRPFQIGSDGLHG